jgi:hypothetical protein
MHALPRTANTALYSIYTVWGNDIRIMQRRGLFKAYLVMVVSLAKPDFGKKSFKDELGVSFFAPWRKEAYPSTGK